MAAEGALRDLGPGPGGPCQPHAGVPQLLRSNSTFERERVDLKHEPEADFLPQTWAKELGWLQLLKGVGIMKALGVWG